MRDPRDYGIASCTPEELHGSDAAENAARLRAALTGGDTPAHREALVLGAALALEVCGATPDASSGVARARKAIASGAAAKLLADLEAFGREASA